MQTKRLLLEFHLHDDKDHSEDIIKVLTLLHNDLHAAGLPFGTMTWEHDPQYVTLNQALKVLKDFQELDPEAFADILGHKFAIPKDSPLHGHPTMICDHDAVSALGLINGMLTHNTNAKGAIACNFDDDGKLLGDFSPTIVKRRIK